MKNWFASRPSRSTSSDALVTNATEFMGQRQFDAALSEIVNTIELTLATNLGQHGAAVPNQGAGNTSNQSSGLLGWICLAVGVVLVFWLIMAVVRAFRGGGSYGNMTGGPGGMSGGYGPGGYGPAMAGAAEVSSVRSWAACLGRRPATGCTTLFSVAAIKVRPGVIHLRRRAASDRPARIRIRPISPGPAFLAETTTMGAAEISAATIPRAPAGLMMAAGETLEAVISEVAEISAAGIPVAAETFEIAEILVHSPTLSLYFPMSSKFMTQYGIAAIRSRIASLEQQYHESLGHAGAAAQNDSNSYHDNFEYEEGMRRADLLARHVSMLRETIKSAVVAEYPTQTERVAIGHVVTLDIEGSGTCQLLICGEGEGGLIEDGCSVASPLGQVLVGMRVGETRVANLPRGATNVCPLAIRAAEPADFRASNDDA